MKLYSDPSIKHEGAHPYRFASNPREQVFAEAWDEQQRRHSTLEWLLCASEDQQIQVRDLTQLEATCAATLIQWLGSPVGWAWLQDTLASVGTRIVTIDKPKERQCPAGLAIGQVWRCMQDGREVCIECIDDVFVYLRCDKTHKHTRVNGEQFVRRYTWTAKSQTQGYIDAIMQGQPK